MRCLCLCGPRAQADFIRLSTPGESGGQGMTNYIRPPFRCCSQIDRDYTCKKHHRRKRQKVYTPSTQEPTNPSKLAWLVPCESGSPKASQNAVGSSHWSRGHRLPEPVAIFPYLLPGEVLSRLSIEGFLHRPAQSCAKYSAALRKACALNRPKAQDLPLQRLRSPCRVQVPQRVLQRTPKLSVLREPG